MAELASSTKDPEKLRAELLAAGFSSTQAMAILQDAMGIPADVPKGNISTGGGYRTNPADVSDYDGTRYGTPPKAKPTAIERSADVSNLAGKVVTSAAAANDTASAVQTMLAAMLGEAATTKAAADTAINEQATAASAVVQAKAAGLASQLAKQSAIVDLVGLNPEAEQSVLRTQLQAWTDAEARMSAVAPVKAALEAINPFANPIAWLAAQAQLRPVNAEYESAALERARVSKDIADRQQITTAQRAFVPAITADSLQQQAKAEADVAAAEAKMKQSEVARANTVLTMQIGQESLRAAGAKVNNDMEAMRAISAALNYQTEAGLKEAEELDLHRARRVMALVGGPRIESYQILKNMKPDVKQEILSVDPDTASPGDVVNLINVLGSRRGLALQSKSAATLYDNIVLAVKPKLDQAVSNPLDKRSPQQKTIDIVNKQVGDWQQEILSGDMAVVSPGNPYRMNAIEYSHAPGMDTNPIAKFVLSQDPRTVVGEKEVLTYIGELARKPETDIDQLTAETVKFFSQGGDYQFESRKMGSMGFDRITTNNKLTYPIGRDVFGFVDRYFKGSTPQLNQVIDFRNPTAVKFFLISQGTQPIAPYDNVDAAYVHQ